MRNVKKLPPGPGNVFAIKNAQGVIELPTIRTTRRTCILDFVTSDGMQTNWLTWKSWGYSVVPLTLRRARRK